VIAPDIYFEKQWWDRGVAIRLDCVRADIRVVTSCACIWEAVARKIGNVHIRSDFSNMSLMDFLTSAIAILPAFDDPHRDSIGEIVAWATSDTQAIVGRNTNLGIILLLAPLALVKEERHFLTTPPVAGEFDFRLQLPKILNATTINDAANVFNAIRHVNPGGLGEARDQDIREKPTVTLLEAMRLAADRDLIARQYTNHYADVFDLGVPAFVNGYKMYGNVEAAIIHCQLAWMAEFPDSLIARKCGVSVAEDVRALVRAMQNLGGISTPEGRAAGVALDRHLRSDGNRLNPGTTADLVCACLFVALREGQIPLNAPFEWKVEDWL
jgi:triphosphoribosyl-dephospho-CoA synthase